MALLHGLHSAFRGEGTELLAVSVDHGLRAGTASELALAADLCARLGLSHTVLSWTGWNGAGNLQDQARQARYQLMADWARSEKIAVLALGHTADDQAETVLMRMRRSAGVNGLSAMAPRRTAYGLTLMRPALGLGRSALRDYLRGVGERWAEDPSNDDQNFERVRVRAALPHLEAIGITAETLSQIAQNMASAREALDWYSFLAARDLARIDGGDVVFDLKPFRALPMETGRRLLVRALGGVPGAP